MPIFSQACEQLGHLASCTSMGVMLVNGEGVKRNPKLGASFFERACPYQAPPKDGKIDSIACCCLGLLFLKGNGVRQDFGLARQILSLSCAFGDPEACQFLQEMDNEIENSLGSRNDEVEL